MTAQLALALRLCAESAGMSEDDVANGNANRRGFDDNPGAVRCAAMRRTLLERMSGNERDDGAFDTWRASAGAVLDRLARTRSDVVFALRAAGAAR